jgi:hypothetical protein
VVVAIGIVVVVGVPTGVVAVVVGGSVSTVVDGGTAPVVVAALPDCCVETAVVVVVATAELVSDASSDVASVVPGFEAIDPVGTRDSDSAPAIDVSVGKRKPAAPADPFVATRSLRLVVGAGEDGATGLAVLGLVCACVGVLGLSGVQTPAEWMSPTSGTIRMIAPARTAAIAQRGPCR